MFAGLYTLPTKAFQTTMTHEIGHGELSHIPRGTVTRVLNDNFWIPIAPKVSGLNSESAGLIDAEAANKMLPLLASASLSRTNELAADAFSIELGVTKFNNPCGMVDAIRTFKQDQESLPFASHPNVKKRLATAIKLVSDEGGGPCFVG